MTCFKKNTNFKELSKENQDNQTRDYFATGNDMSTVIG